MPVYVFIDRQVWFAVSTLSLVQWTTYLKATRRRENCQASLPVRQFPRLHHCDWGVAACVRLRHLVEWINKA